MLEILKMQQLFFYLFDLFSVSPPCRFIHSKQIKIHNGAFWETKFEQKMPGCRVFSLFIYFVPTRYSIISQTIRNQQLCEYLQN